MEQVRKKLDLNHSLFNFIQMPKKLIFSLVVLLAMGSLYAQKKPYFLDEAYAKPSAGNWVLLETLSDEFNKTSQLDEDKWLTSPETYQGWKGRVPGIFAKEAIGVKKGKLRIRASKLAKPMPVLQRGEGRQWTHQGGLVRSKAQGMPGYYYECRMKANKTFMSSTFWLINQPERKGAICDRRTIELDIVECVGMVMTDRKFAQNFDKSMHSNTHDRRPKNQDCQANASNGNNTNLEKGKVYEDYHVYGAWWKNSEEILFFLDGKYLYTVKPPSDFDLPMHIMMVVETYDWNPPQAGQDGMDNPLKERYTYYDWVRTWRLEE